MPDLSLSSDIIVGFPGETYEDFLETLSLVKEVRFQNLFTFIFSPRLGTPAAEMPDIIPREEKGKWFDELLSVQDKISEEISEGEVGKTLRVLCEDTGRCEGRIAARSFSNTVVEFEGDKSLIGKFVTVKINKFSSVLEAEILEDK